MNSRTLAAIAIAAAMLAGCDADQGGLTFSPVGDEARASAELEAERAAEAKKYSATNDVPLSVANPAAWFKETDEKLRVTRQRIIAAQLDIAKIRSQYIEKLRASSEKAAGYAVLAESAEGVREKGRKNGWPVAFDRWVVNSEAELDAKVADMKAFIEKSRILSVEDEALFNQADAAQRNIRNTMVRFDDVYPRFVRAWDKAKLEGFGGIPGDIAKEIDAVKATMEELIYEWNRVK